ncbi:hypothetical protein BJ742DRAFT_335373 [Cladochytrium replicatum]|nr:hypothetical protein BJ742DRAFT_335373 [Cladochytrium replicatum]
MQTFLVTILVALISAALGQSAPAPSIGATIDTIASSVLTNQEISLRISMNLPSEDTTPHKHIFDKNPVDRPDEYSITAVLLDSAGKQVRSLYISSFQCYNGLFKVFPGDASRGVAALESINVVLPSYIPAGKYSVKVTLKNKDRLSFWPFAHTYSATSNSFTLSKLVSPSAPAITDAQFTANQDSSSNQVSPYATMILTDGSVFKRGYRATIALSGGFTDLPFNL